METIKNEKALDVVRQMVVDGQVSQSVAEKYFPELAESENERIRKGVIRNLEYLADRAEGFVKDELKERIAWLEKQGEQKPCMIQWKGDNLKEVIGFTGKDKNFEKWFTSFEEYEKYVHEHNDIFKLFNEDGSHYEVPVGAWIVKTPDGYNAASKAVLKQKTIDKVKPKFHEGEWITNGDYTWKIVEVKPLDYILQSQDGNIVDDTISHVDEQFHSFAIEDAKDCDVLCTYECCEPKIVFILKGIPKKHYALSYHCYYNIMYPHFESDSKKGCLAPNDEDVKPATKEQRDTLFAKMREEGYEWDAEKKELKKIEDEEYNGEDYGIDSLYHAQRILEKTLGKVDGYQSDDGILEHKCAISAVKKLYEQKPAWSEEDEKILNTIINDIQERHPEAMWKINAGSTVVVSTQYIIDWLKSLKDRVQPQTTWKPSESDIRILEQVIDGIENPLNYHATLYAILEHLKKLREE